MRNNAWIALAIVGIIIAFAFNSSNPGPGFIDVLEDGSIIVNNTSTLDFQSPLNVADVAGDAEISLPLADNSVFVGDASAVPVATNWPNCDLGFQATTYSTGSNAIGCQFIPTSRLIVETGATVWSIPGYACDQAAGAADALQNDIVYALIDSAETLSYTAIGINVASAGAGGTVARLGIYEASEGVGGYQPGNLVIDAGTVAIDSTGEKTVVISETLEQGQPYFLAFVHDAAAVSIQRCSTTGIFRAPLTGVAGAVAGSLTSSALQASNAGTGAFSDPAIAPDVRTSILNGTFVKLRR